MRQKAKDLKEEESDEQMSEDEDLGAVGGKEEGQKVRKNKGKVDSAKMENKRKQKEANKKIKINKAKGVIEKPETPAGKESKEKKQGKERKESKPKNKSKSK